jgi:hypothetical protein
LRPLVGNSIFGASNFSYNLSGLAVKSNFIGTGDEPDWEMIYGEWDKEKIDTHNFSGNITANIMNKIQTLTVTANLPPKDKTFTFNSTFNVWISNTTANWRISYPDEKDSWRISHPEKDGQWKLDPFSLTENLNFGDYGSFSQTMALNTEDKELTSLTSALVLKKWGFTVRYNAARMLGSEYIVKGSDAEKPTFEGWRTRQGEAKSGDPNYLIRSRDFSVRYLKNFSQVELWENHVTRSVNADSYLSFDLQQYTNSKFTLNLNFTFNINKILDLSLSTDSENSYIYRYFRNLPLFRDAEIEIPDGPQNNLFLDLLNSFRFDDDKLRGVSGFKMKSFHVSAVHYLGDWNATLNWTMTPYRPAGTRSYEMNNEVSFLLQWIPISEIKSDISYNKRYTPEWVVK